MWGVMLAGRASNLSVIIFLHPIKNAALSVKISSCQQTPPKGSAS